MSVRPSLGSSCGPPAVRDAACRAGRYVNLNRDGCEWVAGARPADPVDTPGRLCGRHLGPRRRGPRPGRARLFSGAGRAPRCAICSAASRWRLHLPTRGLEVADEIWRERSRSRVPGDRDCWPIRRRRRWRSCPSSNRHPGGASMSDAEARFVRLQDDDHLHEECGDLRHPRPPGSGEARLLRALCPAASRPGERWHRGGRRAGAVRPSRHGTRRRGFSDRDARPLGGHLAIGHNRYSTSGHVNLTNAQPLLVNCRSGTLGGRTQRQPRERRGAAPADGSRGLDLPIHERYRSGAALGGAQSRLRRRRDVARSRAAGAGRRIVPVRDGGPADRLPRLAWLPAARHGPARGSDALRLRNLRLRPHRCLVRA